MAGHPYLHADADGSVFLYHGTNCWRRWEINRTGGIEPGRSGYSFFCNTPSEAMAYARAACLRDMGRNSFNSLTSEPVVLKVRFTPRTWVQVDFVQTNQGSSAESPLLGFAVIGPINSTAITSVENCTHATRGSSSVRSFDDGTLRKGIQRLRRKTCFWRLDAWFLTRVCRYWREFYCWLRGGRPVRVSKVDEIRKLILSNR